MGALVREPESSRVVRVLCDDILVTAMANNDTLVEYANVFAARLRWIFGSFDDLD